MFGWWQRYWFAPGGRIAAAAIRIAVATSLLWMLWRIGSDTSLPSQLYYKQGIWMLYPGRPSAAVLAALTDVAWVATAAMLLGLCTRASHAVSLVATMAIAAYGVSDSPTWSHTDVPPILASFALLGARSGDALSLDAWWRKRRGVELPIGAGYQRSVRLVQLAVAAVFALAAYEKLKSGGFGLGWALSDNLRNQLLTRFDWIGAERTAVASWLLAAPWHYELAACASMISQSAPILAVFFVRRPWLRAVVGTLWCAEVVGLGHVMNLWNLHWLPLAAAFVDWDALAARIGVPRDTREPVRSRGALAFVTAFVAFFALQGLWLNQRLHAFPFSSFPMFAVIRAKRPYSEHQSYEMIGGDLEPLGADGNPAVAAWVSQRATYRWLWRERDPVKLPAMLDTVLAETRRGWPDAHVTGIRLWLSVFQAPAYPEPARLDRIDLAIVGELDLPPGAREHGVFRSELGTLLPDGRTWLAPGGHREPADLHVAAIYDDLPDPVPVEMTPTPLGFVLAAPLRGDPAYLIGRMAGESKPWLLAVKARRGF
ncbi:MAG TPA: hypothetical protein VMJ10_09270 [Kofleriaceae bacterium]|nr:hypothetical protein [Kofleriaceae bacterium]